MTEDQDHKVDLSPLAPDAERRAARMTSRVMERIGAFRDQETREADVSEAVRRRLARFALPAALAAAISFFAILLTGRDSSRPPELFTVVILGSSPAAEWIVRDQPPEIPELLRALDDRR
jgi:hypothetical protein